MESDSNLPPRVPLPLRTCLVWLSGSVVVILLSLVLRVGAGRSVVIPVVNQIVPETCALYSRLGIDCPGCGLTRCFIHLSHGNFTAAWRLNAVGVFLYAFVLLQLVLASYHLLAATRVVEIGRWASGLTAVNQALLITLAVSLFGQWLLGFLI